MMLDNKNTPPKVNVLDNANNIDDIESGEKRKIYVKPHLDEMGDLRSLTLGITGGINESGLGTENHW